VAWSSLFLQFNHERWLAFDHNSWSNLLEPTRRAHKAPCNRNRLMYHDKTQISIKTDSIHYKSFHSVKVLQLTNLRNHQVLVICIDELWPWLPTVSAHPKSPHFLYHKCLQHYVPLLEPLNLPDQKHATPSQFSSDPLRSWSCTMHWKWWTCLSHSTLCLQHSNRY
jgi:hypothetical protein